MSENDKKKLPCTACNHCTAYCPVSINIPGFLSFYNDSVAENEAVADISSINSNGTPSDCVGCGSCRAQCPLSINIPYYMEVLEKEYCK